MALRKSEVLLPDVFQTTKNKKFLNATVDQLISEPNLQRVNSFIGRKFAPNFAVGDSYVNEIDSDRENYQLEPAVVYRDSNGNIENLTGYPDFINQLRYNNVNVNTHNDLFNQEYYNYSGFVDLDKLVNYGEYFWLPAGPDSVQVFNSTVDTEKDYVVTRRVNGSTTDYSVDSSDNGNPTLTVARGGSYTFTVAQTGTPFYLQTSTGLTGISDYGSNVSIREILGVENNGTDNGTITWNVPETDAQNDKILATQAANPDFATDLTYKQIHNVPYATFIAEHGGIDVQTEIDGKTLVFVNTSTVLADWEQGDLFDGYAWDSASANGLQGSFDTTTTIRLEDRYDVYNISLKTIAGVNTIVLQRGDNWPVGEKVKIKQGNAYGNREFFKNSAGLPEIIEPYTAGLDRIYYQDGENSTQFGTIEIVDVQTVATINVTDDILGKLQYTSTNSVTFSNGLKIEFNNDVTPSTYAGKQFYVEGVGQPGGIQLIPTDEMITPETYTVSTSDGFDTVGYDIAGYDGTLNAPTTQDYILINRGSPDRNAWSRGNRWFHRRIIEATAAYNEYTVDVDDTVRAKRPIIEFYSGLELFNMGTSSATPVTVIDTTQTDALSNVNGTVGYFADGIDLQQDHTIIFSADTNSNVSNKVYRVDKIIADESAITADSLKKSADDQTVGADGGNTTGKDEIINLVEITTIVDSNSVLSTLGATNQGKMFWLEETTWTEAQQKTSINQDPLFDVFDPDHTSFSDQTKYPSSNFVGSKLFSYKRNNNSNPDVVLEFGLTYKNFSTIGDIVFENNFDSDLFQYTKTTGNTNVIVRSGHAHQFDINSIRVLYNGWTKTVEESTQYQIVSYTVADELNTYEIGASVDTVGIRQHLQVFVNGKFKYPSQYNHLIQNDREYVVFSTALVENDTVTIKFVSKTKAANSFYEVPSNLENNAGNATFETLTLGQMRNHTTEISRQIKTLEGVAPGSSNIRDTNFRAYPGNILQHSAGMMLPMYLLGHREINTVDSINFVKNEYTKFKNKFLDNINKLDLDISDSAKCVDDILIHMTESKTTAFPFYYNDMVPFGDQKTQLVYVIDDASETEFEFTTQFDLTSVSERAVLVYHTEESSGTKNLLIEGLDYVLDSVEAKVTLVADNLGVGLIGLSVDDSITVVEYTSTNGSFVPPTPTKLGLYYKYSPKVEMDATYISTIPEGTGPFKIYNRDTQTDRSYYNKLGWYYPLFTTEDAAKSYDTSLGGSGLAHTHKFEGVSGVFYMPNSSMNHATNNVNDFVEYTATKPVIRGHDGSRWIGYGDIRDNIVLELEKRIFNNIKTQYNNNLLDFAEILPGYFRSTLTDLGEANNITRSYFGEWALRNKVKVQANTNVDSNNPFTWNYRNSVYKGDKSRIPGHWRAIYQWFFDTDHPQDHPWEMLGLSTKPSWWDGRYGVAPYTSGNTVLWEDLRDGKLYSDSTGTTFTTLENRKRADLLSIIPVNEQGQLRAPAEFLVESAVSTNVSDDWAFGDNSPGENAWKRSSEYPYVIQILAATIKAAKYGTLLFDTNLYKNNAQYDQILQKDKSYRPSIVDYKMHGQGNGAGGINRIEGYNQFIGEFIKFNGYNIDTEATKINNLKLNLSYSMAGFTDKSFIKVVAESVTPSSQTENIFIPDEDLSIYMKKSLPLERVVYSGVQIIQRGDGYEIQGYDIENPFFKIIPSVTSSTPNEIRVGETVMFEYKDFERRIVNIPYGTVIRSRQQVFDFLVAYQRYLLSRGFVFDGTTGAGGRTDFVSSGQEFAFWTDQKWPIGSVIVISPYHESLKVNRQFATVDDLTKNAALKDANAAIIKPKFYDVSRTDNLIEIKIDTENTNLYSAKLNPIQHEHVLVFNNTTIFNDIIYQPELGNRHSRLKLLGSKSGDWNGTQHAPGFFINEDKIAIWEQYVDYKKGDIVSHQGTTYVAKYEIDGSSVFDFNNWTIADNIKTGLVKNLTNKASQFKDFFEVDNLNLEDGVDKLGKGIIGFNEKSYLAGLGLDDVSQVKFYQGMIKQKGTGSAINKLIDAELSNLNQEIDYFEEWAFRVGEFGSIDSNQVIETIVPEEEATNNPTVVHFHADGELPSDTDLGHYHVQEKDLYKTPNNYTGNVFANRDAKSRTLNDLDSAGYARLDDVDFTVFDISDIELLSDRIGSLGKGKKIWIATDTTNTWGMRRIDETLSTVIRVESTTNGFLVYTTDVNHGLVEDDYVIIRAAQPIGKVAKIAGTPNPNQFVVVDETTEADLSDVHIPMYKLSTVRFGQPSDLSTYTPVSGWDNKELVWVDKDNDGDWQVLQNARPWSTTGIKTQASITASDKAGTSVALNTGGTLAMVGAPELGAGVVTPYLRSEGGALIESTLVSIATIGDSVDGFGFSVDSSIDYAVVGAPETESLRGAVFTYFIDGLGAFSRRPALRPTGLSDGHRFGHSVAMSRNGRHLFASAPGATGGVVYAYTLIEINDSNAFVKTVTGNASATAFALGFTPLSIQALNVTDENGKVYLPTKDFTISGTNMTFTATPANGLDIVIRQEDYFAEIGILKGHDVLAGDNFGWNIDCDYEGRNIIIGAPDADIANTDSTVLTSAGEVYIFAQTVERFIGDGSTKAFTTQDTLQTKVYVEVDGVLQTETNNPDVPTDNDGSSDGFYTRASNTITLKYVPASGAKIVVYTGSFREKQKIDQNISGQAPTENEQFGLSVAIDSKGTMVAIGSPGEDETNPNTGSVFIFQDAGKNYSSVTTSTSVTTVAADSIYVDDYRIALTGTNAAGLVTDITNAKIPGVTAATNSAGAVVITTTNTESLNKLTLNPGVGQAFERNAVIQPFSFVQKINHPQAYENENFGNKVAFDKHVGVGTSQYAGTRNLVISSDKASTLLPVGFDVESNTNSQLYQLATTTFDESGTTFTDRQTQSGAAYIYELLDSNTPTLLNPSKMVFGQQLRSSNITDLDQFGASIVFNDNRVFIGAPNDTTLSGSTTLANSGSVYEFNNNTRSASWQPYRSQDDRVDVTQINRVALYNKREGEIQVFLDYIDPAKGKVAGVAEAELTYVSKADPALYNNNWTYKYKNRLWWDTSTVHYLNAEQGNIDFRTNYWGIPFPGSSIDVYEWIESPVVPSQYTGEGTVRDITQFNIANVYESNSDSTQVRYYFWVKDRTDVPVEAEFRTISADSVRSVIQDPKAQGIPYVAFLDNDAIAMFNCKQYFADQDTVLSVNYDVVKNEGILHSEFELFGRGNIDQDIPTRMYTKLVDSLAGSDSVGNLVPDPFLSEVEKYGVLTQPRQGMFVNRASALKVLTQYCNNIFTNAPFARNSSLTKLSSSETLPTVNSGEYDISVDTVEERDFLNTDILTTGYNVLVLEDNNNNNYWAIYTLQSDDSWLLSNIQGYNTADYWSYATYYSEGYDATTVPTYQVVLESDLLILSQAVTGEVAKVTSNDEGNFSLFEKTDTGWDEVVIERGTIQFNNSLYSFSTLNTINQATGFDNDGFDFAAFDKVPADEIRQIVQALKDDLFVGDYEINMNELFFRLMEYALNENNFTQDWLFKSSFITVAHKIRSLDQYNTFKYDNTTFIEDFINEVKPYKTKIREYVSKYDKTDLFQGDTTDFDLHSFYDDTLGIFRKPSGDYGGDTALQADGLNKPWNDYHGYSLNSIEIVNAGTGYITDPTLTISAPNLTGGVQATATAKTNGDTIISVTLNNKGSGYTADPIITILGSGTGVLVSPRLVNTTVRSFDTTIKFDRITYSSTVKDWTASTAYEVDDIVAYQNTVTKTQEVYTVTTAFTSSTTFSVENSSGTQVLTVKADADFDNAADRIAAYYYPSSMMIGDSLELLQKGTGYGGTKVTGPGFDQNPGFDSSNFDVIGFDNIEIDADGIAVIGGLDTVFRGIDFPFSGIIGDAYVEAGYFPPGYVEEINLGIAPESITIDGAGFVDTYNSHAPEELVPGKVYDTLDMEVYTHSSHDYDNDGNGVEVQYTSHSYPGITARFFADSVQFSTDSEIVTADANGVTLSTVPGDTRTFRYGDPDKSEDDFVSLVVYRNQERQYTFTTNFRDNTVTLDSPLTPSDILHIYAYSQTGESMVGNYTLVGDGSTAAFTLPNTLDDTQQTLIYVDGVETFGTLLTRDNRSFLTLNSTPANGAHIHIFVFDQLGLDSDATGENTADNTAITADDTSIGADFEGAVIERIAPTKFQLKTFEMDGSTTVFDMGLQRILYAQPGSANTVVEVDNIRLRPENNRYHTAGITTTEITMDTLVKFADDTTLTCDFTGRDGKEFDISTTGGETEITNANAISVTLIPVATGVAVAQQRYQDFNITAGDSADNSVITADDVTTTTDAEGRLFVTMITAPAEGDTVIITDATNAEYTVSADGAQVQIADSVAQTSSSILRVNSFTNHDPLRIQTKVFVGEGNGSVTSDDGFDEVAFDSAGFDRQSTTGTIGTYIQDRALSNVNNFWITVDGERLHPGDYTVNGNDVDLSEKFTSTADSNTVVIVTHFTENLIQPPIGFRIFQDMNGTVEYLRLAKDNTTVVIEEIITPTSTKIFVDDASVLPFVTPNSEYPGVVFIGGERITYWEISLEDNYITSLRRATKGTGMVQRIQPGFIVVDGGQDQYLPSSDTHTQVWYDMSVSAADSTVLRSDSTVVFADATGQASGEGLQESATANAKFLLESQAQVPNYRLELQDKGYFANDYVEADYAEDLL